MKLSAVLIALFVSSSQSFSMLTPRSYFPQRFGTYLEEIDEIFEKDWPSTFMEEQLSEFKRTMKGETKDEFLTTYKTSSPKYEVLDTAEKFELKIDVPNFKPDEFEIGLRAGGRVLTVTGKHEEKDKQRQFMSTFQQNFSLDPSIVVDEITANFHDGKIIVSAPRKVERLPESRKIPIKMLAETKGVEHGEKAEHEKKATTKQKKGLKP